MFALFKLCVQYLNFVCAVFKLCVQYLNFVSAVFKCCAVSKLCVCSI